MRRILEIMKVNFVQKIKISVLAGAYEVYDTYKQLTSGSIEEYSERLDRAEAAKEEVPVERKIGFC